MLPQLVAPALLILSYLVGAIPIGFLLVLKLKGIDIRTIGSGNVGSTNVSRAAGPLLGRIVFCLDVLKGLVPPVAAQLLHLDSVWVVLAGLASIVGHVYSVFLNFKGGKGIATSAGVLVGLAPAVFCLEIVIFIGGYMASSMISVGSVLAALALPFAMFLFFPHDKPRLAFAIVAGGLAIYRHRENLQRLRNGTEPKADLFGLRKLKNTVPDVSAPKSPPAENGEDSPRTDATKASSNDASK